MRRILHHLTIEPDPRHKTIDQCSVDQGAIWRRAEVAFRLASELIFVHPNLADYYREGLRHFQDDGVLYVEPRSLLMKVRARSSPKYRNPIEPRII